MVEGNAFYEFYKLRVLIIPCKLDDFRLFIGLPDEKSPLLSLSKRKNLYSVSEQC